MPALVKNSGAACGPSVTPISQSDTMAGRRPTGTGADTAAGLAWVRPAPEPARRTSPVARARPPCPPNLPSVNVDALPRYGGTAKPPRTAREQGSAGGPKAPGDGGGPG